MDLYARRLWQRLIPLLEEMGVLSRIDGKLLERYCRLWSQWHTADKRCSRYGRWDQNGVTPWARTADAISAQLIQIERECGLTPAARARLVPTPSKREKSRKDRLKERFG